MLKQGTVIRQSISLRRPSNFPEFPLACTSMSGHDIGDVFQCFQSPSCHLRLVLYEVLQDSL